MKKILLVILLLLSTLSFGQYKIPTTKSKSFIWKNGYEKNVTVKFQYFLDEELKPMILNKIIESSMYGAKYKLNNPLSFVPVELTIEDSNGNIETFVRFRGKNSYGAESETTIFYDFNNLGENLTNKAELELLEYESNKIKEYIKKQNIEYNKTPEEKQKEKDSINNIMENKKIDSLSNIKKLKPITDNYIKIDTLMFDVSQTIPSSYGFKYNSINRLEYYKQKIKYSVVSNEYYYSISFSKHNMYSDYPNDKESVKPSSFLDIQWVFTEDIKEIYVDGKLFRINYNRENIGYYKNLLELFKIISEAKNVYIIKYDVKINLLYFPNDAKKILEEYHKTINQKINWSVIK